MKHTLPLGETRWIDNHQVAYGGMQGPITIGYFSPGDDCASGFSHNLYYPESAGRISLGGTYFNVLELNPEILVIEPDGQAELSDVVGVELQTGKLEKLKTKSAWRYLGGKDEYMFCGMPSPDTYNMGIVLIEEYHDLFLMGRGFGGRNGLNINFPITKEEIALYGKTFQVHDVNIDRIILEEMDKSK